MEKIEIRAANNAGYIVSYWSRQQGNPVLIEEIYVLAESASYRMRELLGELMPSC